MDIHASAGRSGGADVFLELRGLAMGFAKAGGVADFEMELDKEMAVELVSGERVDAQTAALGESADGLEDVLAERSARLDVDDDVGGNDFADAPLDLFAGGVGLLEAGAARDGDGDIDKIALAGAAGANALGFENAGSLADRLGNAVAEAAGGGVQKSVEGAPAEAGAEPKNDAGDDESGERVERAEPGNAETHAEPSAGDAEDDDKGAPNVGGKMEGVGFEGVAGIFGGDAAEGTGAKEINAHGEAEDEDGRQTGTDMNGVEEEALEGFPNDVESGDEEETGLNKGGEIFDLAVAIKMLGIGGLIGNANGKIGDDGGDAIEDGMQGFGEDTQAAGDDGEKDFEPDQYDGGSDGGKGRLALFAGGSVGSLGHGERLYAGGAKYRTRTGGKAGRAGGWRRAKRIAVEEKER